MDGYHTVGGDTVGDVVEVVVAFADDRRIISREGGGGGNVLCYGFKVDTHNRGLLGVRQMFCAHCKDNTLKENYTYREKKSKEFGGEF